MTLRLIGAGLGRTGTHSLKLALERLLGAPCYHMSEVVTNHREHMDLWRRAALGDMPDWNRLFAGYAAAVDMPASQFWRELMEAFPDAPVLLSLRDPESWWQSVHATIFRPGATPPSDFLDMVQTIAVHRFTTEVEDRAATIAAFEAHNAAVIGGVPADRLVVWRAEDGWGPICRALGLPVPDAPFPHSNTAAEFRARPIGQPMEAPGSADIV